MFAIGLVVYFLFLLIFLAGVGLVIYHLYRFGLIIEHQRNTIIVVVIIIIAAVAIVISSALFAAVPWNSWNLGGSDNIEFNPSPL